MSHSREVLSPEGLRPDGRRPTEIRKVDVELDVLEGADGSCKYTQGHTQILASVIGPAESKSRMRHNRTNATLDVEFVTSAFASQERRDTVKGSRAAKEAAIFIEQIFSEVIQTELFPSSHIQISVTVLSNNGSALACAINAVTLACMQAGLPMRDLVFATTASIADNVPVLDLNTLERNLLGIQVTLAQTHAQGEIIGLQSEAQISTENLDVVMKLAASGCNTIGGICKSFARNYINALAETIESSGVADVAALITTK